MKFLPLLASVLGLSGMSAQGALITFSTLNNGRNTSMDPEIQVTWFRIENLATPYQPLATGYEQVFGMAKDGDDIDVTINWSSYVAHDLAGAGFFDHTRDQARSMLYGDQGSPFSMTFSQPVLVPSLFWTLNEWNFAPYNGVFDARIRAWNGDTLVSEVLLEYPETTNSVWQEYTTLAGTAITRIEFFGNISRIHVDDMTVAVPEPAGACLTGIGVIALAWMRRRRK